MWSTPPDTGRQAPSPSRGFFVGGVCDFFDLTATSGCLSIRESATVVADGALVVPGGRALPPSETYPGTAVAASPPCGKILLEVAGAELAPKAAAEH